MLVAQPAPETAESEIDHTEREIELIMSFDYPRKSREPTLILGYSTAGSSPSKVLLNKTKPEYSA